MVRGALRETITDIPSLLEIELGDHPDIMALAEAITLLEDLRAEIDAPDENRSDEEKKLWEKKVWQRIEDTRYIPSTQNASQQLGQLSQFRRFG